MKKILFILNEFPKRSETFVLDQINFLIEKGCEVHILGFDSFDGYKDKSQRSLKYKNYRLHLCENVSNKYKKWLRIILETFLILFRYPILFYKFLILSRKFGKGIPYSDILLFRHTEDIKSIKFDIIVCHFGPNGNRGVLLRKLNRACGKIVTFFHGYDLTSYVLQFGSKIYDRLFAEGDHFFCISELWKQKLIDLGCSPDKISVQHMGIDVCKFRESPFKDWSQLNFLTVCRMVEKKGLRYVIDALRILKAKGVKFSYKIVGDGPLESELKKMVAANDLEPNILFMGPLERDEIVELTNKVNIFILPSVQADDGDMEGIPVVLMEAMAAGLIAVSTFHSGIPELIENDINGFLVPEKDSVSISERILEIEKMSELQKRLIIKNARLTILQEFNSQKLNEALWVKLTSI
jgi:colanic acid/amylovoran biosynthesis glycosyltransferase